MTEEGLTLRDQHPSRSLWQRIVDLALTDVSVLVRGIDQAAVERLEQVLLEADFGVAATVELVGELERAAERGKVSTESELRALLAEHIRSIFAAVPAGDRASATPAVTLLLGVNGTGKTTTAAKLARLELDAGRTVLLAATDTFRSGAQEQLRLWADRLGAGYVGGQQGGDPASVAYDAAEAALSRRIDHLIVDTAGRLHTRRGLLEELRKIDRVLGRLVPGAPHDRLLVVDATSGQNVLNQVRDFGHSLPLSGIVLAKYDSSARAGTAVAVAREHRVPIRWLGIGEAERDLARFDVERYVAKLLS